MKALEDQFTITVQIGPGLLGQALSSDTNNTKSKTTKTEANYHRAPHAEANESSVSECGNCCNFHGLSFQEDSPGYCDLVSGLIDEEFVCDFFKGAVKGA